MEAESILQERKSKGKKEYLVRWKGQGAESDSWEPASNVPQKIIRRFSSPKKTPKKSRSRSASRGRRGRSRSKGRTPSKSPSRRRSAPTTGATRQSRRLASSTTDSEVRTETITSKTETKQNDIGHTITTTTEEKVVTLKKSPVSSQESSSTTWRIPDLNRYYNSDYAMIIVFTCITIITLSFVMENKVDFAAVWDYIKNLLNSLVTMMTSVFPSGSQSKGTTRKQ